MAQYPTASGSLAGKIKYSDCSETEMTTNTHRSYEDDEINLTELLVKLWQGRWAVATTTGVGLVLASLYAITAPQVWIASATLAPPSYEQMGDYYLVKTQLDSTPFFKSAKKPPTITLDQSPPTTPPKTGDEISDQLFESMQLLLDTTPEVTVLRPDRRKQQLYQVQASATNPTAAQQKLTHILTKINRQLADQKTRELRSQLALLQRSLHSELDIIARQARAARAQELASTHQALDSAKRANLVHFEGSNYTGLDTPSMRYLLGSKLLQARLATLKQSSPDYPPRYYEVTTQLADIQELPQIQTGNLAGFQLVTPPTASDKPSSPKGILVIALGIAGGLLLGCARVLCRDPLVRLQAKLRH
ncbi:Wzz/FepE/Etk N-terminal domain-containing protein [Vogesella sp. EB]|uniref:Wzz/FepE/Etk N-terminal domain-containing protein n=1 Tax=Vogesella sp. EB TaxID=1526735 RepID=UPI00138E2750|nr:Wzz/FepE/Etk N-terminal domain-containing protein [Vogesella sp. EB]